MSLSWCQACSSCSSCVPCDATQDNNMLHFPNVKLCCVALRCAKLWDLQLCIMFHAGLRWSYLMFSGFLPSAANHSIQHDSVPAVNNAPHYSECRRRGKLSALHQSGKGDSVLLLLTGDLWKSTVWSVDGCRTCQRDWWEETKQTKFKLLPDDAARVFSIIQ